MARLIGSCGLAATLLFSLNAFAQSPQSQTYGTQAEIALVVQATAFTPWNSTMTYAGGISTRYVSNNNGCCLVAPVSLPSGASVIGIEVQGCDYSPTADITAIFAVCRPVTGCNVPLPYVSTSGTPGCS